MRLFPRLTLIGTCLAAALLLGFAAPARAANTDFLSNLGASRDNDGALGGSSNSHEKFILFQGFHAGGTSADFKLRSVKIRLKTEPPSGGFIRGALCDETNSGEPDSSDNSSCLDETINGDRIFSAGVKTSGSGNNTVYTFTLPADHDGIDLEPGNQYFIAMEYDPGSSTSSTTPEWHATNAGSASNTFNYRFDSNNFAYGQKKSDGVWEMLKFFSAQYLSLLNGNGVPTGSGETVNTNEDTELTFEESHFGYSDVDSDSLDHVIIKSLPALALGTLQLNGNDIEDEDIEVSASDIQDQNLKYVPLADANGTTSFYFRVNDGTNGSNESYQMIINVTAVNDAPVVSDSNVTTNEDTPYTFEVDDFVFEDDDQTDDVNEEGDSLSHLRIITLPGDGKGTLELKGTHLTSENVNANEFETVMRSELVDGDLKYHPPLNANGTDFTFDFKAEDGIEASALAATMTIRVTPVNDLPVVSDSEVETDEDTPYTFEVDDFVFEDDDQTDDVNEEGDSLSHLIITTLPGDGKGTLELDGNPLTSENVNENESQMVERSKLVDGDLKYRPPLNANGTDFTSFDFKANDGLLDSESAATMTINVTAVNDPPTASNKRVDLVEDDSNPAHTFVEGDFGFEDIDSNATLNEDPTLNATLDRVKIISLPGEDDETDKGTLSLAGNDITSATEANPVEVTTTQLDNNDFTYTLPANANGSPYETFNFKVYDGMADSEISYTVSFYVEAVNDQPVAEDDPIVADANTVYVINVLENDSDVDGDTLIISALGTGDNAPANGTAEIISFGSTPAVRYTPDNDFIGTDEFTYTISDEQSPALTNTATVKMTVVPKLVGSKNENYPENGTTATNGTDNVDVVVAEYSATGTPTWSLAGDDLDDFSINANGELGFKILPDYENPTDADTDNEYKITVQATVEVGGVPYTGTRDVTVTVYGVDEDVVWSVQQNTEFSFAENGTAAAATITVTDPEKNFDSSIYSGDDISSFTHGTYTETLDGGARELPITFENVPDYEGPTDGNSGNDNVYEANLFVITGDSQGDYKSFTLYFTIRVTDVNDAPVAGDDNPSTNEDTVVVISVLANDTDEDKNADESPKDTLSVTAVGTQTAPSKGIAVITPGSTTTITYTPNLNANGTDSFSYRVSDDGDPALTAIGTVTVTVNAVNDAPVAVDDEATTNEATAVTIPVIDGDDTGVGTDTDVDKDADGNQKDTLTVTAVGTADGVDTETEINPAYGTVAYTPNGTTVTYMPSTGFAGIDTFTYTVSDGTDTDTGTVTVLVTPTVNGLTAIEYQENDTDLVATYMANGSPTWSLSGTDSDKFDIGSGALSFNQSPDFEKPTDNNTDNVYELTVVATITEGNNSVTGMLAVTVEVTNADAGTDPRSRWMTRPRPTRERKSRSPSSTATTPASAPTPLTIQTPSA